MFLSMRKAIIASRGRVIGNQRNSKDGVWIQQTEYRTDKSNSLTSVDKDNLVLLYAEDS